MNNGPLDGVIITEFTSAWAGPYATLLLAFLGAQVIKVESQKRLDHSRKLSFSTGKIFKGEDRSSVFNNLNLNKHGVRLNLSKPKAIEIAKKLVSKSDAVMENMRPGVMQRLGLGYEALYQVKPDIIYLSSSACGQKGPDNKYVGYAPTFASLGGASFITGYEDWPPSNFTGSIDLRSGATAASAILAALLYHQQTGEGQYIDMASQETIAVLIGEILLDYVMNNKIRMRKGNRDDFMAPHNCYKCRGDDKWISIAVATDSEWHSLCRVMEKPELAECDKFSDVFSRFKNQKEIDEIIGNWTINYDYYELTEKLQKEHVAATPSLSSKGLFNDPHINSRNVYDQVEHPFIGKDWVLTPPWKFSDTPAKIRRHAPLFGEHNEFIFCGLLDMTKDEIKELEKEQVIY